jgi:hypothetical protein
VFERNYKSYLCSRVFFWQIEHDAYYKPRDPVLRGAANKPVIRERTERVYDAFDELENVLERELQKNVDFDA